VPHGDAEKTEFAKQPVNDAESRFAILSENLHDRIGLATQAALQQMMKQMTPSEQGIGNDTIVEALLQQPDFRRLWFDGNLSADQHYAGSDVLNAFLTRRGIPSSRFEGTFEKLLRGRPGNMVQVFTTSVGRLMRPFVSQSKLLMRSGWWRFRAWSEKLSNSYIAPC